MTLRVPSVLLFFVRTDPLGQARLLALVCANVALGLVPVHGFRWLVDRAIPQHDQGAVVALCGALLGVAILRAVGEYQQTLAAEELRAVLHATLRADLTSRILRLAPDWFAKHPVGQIANRIQTEVGRLGMSVPQVLVQPMVEGVTFTFSLGYLLSMSPTLTGVALTALPLVLLVAPRANARLAEAARAIGVHLGQYSAALQESLSNVVEIQVHGTWAWEEARLRHAQDLVGADAVAIARYGGWLTLAVDLSRFVAPVVVYGWGALLAMRGEMAVGEIVAFAGVLGALYGSLDKLARVPPLWRTAQDRFEELTATLSLPPWFVDGAEGPPTEAGRGAVVALEGVRFAHDRGRAVVDGIDLVVGAGERVALVGRSGCGKSTLLQLVCGRLRPTEGRVSLDGVRPEDHTLRALTDTVGVVSQTPVCFAGTLRHNLAYALLRAERGDPTNPGSWVDPAPDDLDAALLDACESVAFGDDLVDLGLQVRLPEARADAFLALRRSLAAEAAAPDVSPFVEGAWLPFADVCENLLFAPDDDGKLDAAELAAYAAGARKAGLGGWCARIGLAAAEQDLALLASASPDRWRALGTSAEDLAERARLSEAARGRALTAEALGDEVFDALVRRGLVARTTDPALRAEGVAGRARMRAALGAAAPPPYEPTRWHARLSIRDNLVFGHVDPTDPAAALRVAGRLRVALAEAGLLDRVRRAALDLHVGERGARLSGGQRQKVALARVLLKRPRLLLLDEVTASLDAAGARQVFDVFARPDPATTVIAVTHQLAWLDRFDRVVVLDAGRVVESGAPATLLASGGALARLAAETRP